MKNGRPALALPIASALALIAFLRLRFVTEPPGPLNSLGLPPAPGLYTTLDLLFFTALFIWSIAKFGEEENTQPLWPYALSVALCSYPLLTCVF